MKERFQTKNVLLTTSCTHALEMAAFLADIQPGDEVIMPSYTFVSTADAFVLRGATCVFVDIRPDTMNIDETKIEEAITEKTKAIVPVHYAGVSCAMDEIMAIAKKYNLKENRTALSHGIILCLMEAVAAKITDCSQCFSFIKSIHSLRGIFHHFQVIFFRNCHDLIHCTADACIMNRRVIVAYGIFFGVLLLNTWCYTKVDMRFGPVIDTAAYVFVLIFSRVILNEKITKGKLVGNLLIIAGILIYTM